ncbi:hypothetical protein [Rhodothermus marinus]|uniref:hypothetical protein n=1 Tax=Rhodothermus marinus TaxID=29549 RepID=UPI0006D251CB|nr:hypothetical protein [Rhodothermus marinus]
MVQLVWTPGTDDFDYVVERAPAESEAFTAVATTQASRFIDQDGQGGMRYRVRARNVAAVAGPASAAVTVPLPAPTGVSASMQRLTGDVQLQWQPVSGAVAYEIYRNDTRRGTFARIGETSNPAFVDSQGSSGPVTT